MYNILKYNVNRTNILMTGFRTSFYNDLPWEKWQLFPRKENFFREFLMCFCIIYNDKQISQ